MRRSVRALLIAAATLVAVTALARGSAAQAGITFNGGVLASGARIARAGVATAEFSGPVLGATGGLAMKRLSLEATYLEGQLSPTAGTLGTKEVLAEASVVLRVGVGGGFTLGAGPRARAFIADGGTVRWMRLEARAGYTGEVIPGRAHADVELWQVLSAEVNAQGGADGGRGGTAGLSILIPNSRFAVRVAYSADRVAFGSGATEFVDGVEIGLRIGRF